MMSTIDAPAIDAPVRQPRYLELDSLRGLAALIVVLHHLRLLWETDTQPTSAVLNFFLGLVGPFGTESVMLFFVLSGFVLSLPAVEGRPQPYVTFLIRRIFRIYVPYLAALLVAVSGAFWLHGIVTRSTWFHEFWAEPVSWHAVGQHVLFLGVYNVYLFDPPIWSLVHEMRISIIFPLLCGLVLRFKSRWSLAIVAGLTITAIMIEKRPLQIVPLIADSFQYAGLFVLGIFLARERGRLEAWFRGQRRLVKVLIGTASLWLFLFAGQAVAGPPSHFLHHSRVYVAQLVTAFGAGGLMIVSINSAFLKRILSWQPIHFLGEISYSLYLWHFIVLLFCVHLLYGKTPLWGILCLTLVLSIPVSWCSYLWIEKPSMNLGRRLSNSFQRARPA
jgi:peptidoglycan/LPS O-acetylase OafA/YrhL